MHSNSHLNLNCFWSNTYIIWYREHISTAQKNHLLHLQQHTLSTSKRIPLAAAPANSPNYSFPFDCRHPGGGRHSYRADLADRAGVKPFCLFFSAGGHPACTRHLNWSTQVLMPSPKREAAEATCCLTEQALRKTYPSPLVLSTYMTCTELQLQHWCCGHYQRLSLPNLLLVQFDYGTSTDLTAGFIFPVKIKFHLKKTTPGQKREASLKEQDSLKKKKKSVKISENYHFSCLEKCGHKILRPRRNNKLHASSFPDAQRSGGTSALYKSGGIFRCSWKSIFASKMWTIIYLKI